MADHHESDLPWDATWEGARQQLLESTLAATPAQRLACLEEMLSIAYRAGALQPEMRHKMSENPEIRSRIKRLIVDALHLEGVAPSDIEDDAPLFGEGLGLDSVDALELVVALEKEFRIRIQSHDVGKEAFASVSTMADFIEGRLVSAGDSNAGG